ncbi:hypothetical protein M514_01766 [Trichuris suis]|uniref:Uncharacterized protein n=1 Tax=Trichuris suis TaxID=68888 RepID=A0A085NT49_9BILA|nr:hypothetical protein M513_01766 [Trichuris suis]KFD72645.1 hypothetical protein M514_01766 [Trichuris suis]
MIRNSAYIHVIMQKFVDLAWLFSDKVLLFRELRPLFQFVIVLKKVTLSQQPLRDGFLAKQCDPKLLVANRCKWLLAHSPPVFRRERKNLGHTVGVSFFAIGGTRNVPGVPLGCLGHEPDSTIPQKAFLVKTVMEHRVFMTYCEADDS